MSEGVRNEDWRRGAEDALNAIVMATMEEGQEVPSNYISEIIRQAEDFLGLFPDDEQDVL